MSRRRPQHTGPYWTRNAYQKPQPRDQRDTGCPELGHAIAKARIRNDLRQADLAERIGASRTQIAKWESAARPVPLAFIGPLRRALGTSLAKNLVEYRISNHQGLFVRVDNQATLVIGLWTASGF